MLLVFVQTEKKRSQLYRTYSATVQETDRQKDRGNNETITIITNDWQPICEAIYTFMYLFGGITVSGSSEGE